jgi:hypothetical protein
MESRTSNSEEHKAKAEETELVAASIWDFAIVLQSSEKSKLEMTERVTTRILEAEERNRKTTIEGQLALTALFLNSLKQQPLQGANMQSNHGSGTSTGIPDMQAHDKGVRIVYLAARFSHPKSRSSFKISIRIISLQVKARP